MAHSYELFLAGSNLSTEDIQAFSFKIAKHLGSFSNYEFFVIFSDSVTRFFVRSPKDISHISEGLSLGVLKPINAIPTKQTPDSNFIKNRLLHVKATTNIYQFKEEIKTKKGLDLQEAIFKVKVLPMQTLITKANFLYHKSGLVSQSSVINNGFPAGFIAIDFTQNKRYFKKSFPSYLNIEKAIHGLSQNPTGALLEVDGFPYFSDKRYLNLNSYQFDKHSFIIGSSGSGKSKFIELLISKIANLQFKNNYKIIVIDPHASLAEGLVDINGSKIIDFKNSSTDLFPDANSDVSAATELTSTLFKSLMADSYNPKLDTVLKFSLLVLLTAQAMSLGNLKTFITDIDFRNKILDHVGDYIPTNVKKFFGADFNELRTKYYNDAISPISSLVDEMQTQPAISGDDQYSLTKHLQENFLTVFSLNKVSMGEKVVKTVAGLLIQQIFLIAQSRVINEKIIMFIDEVSVVQNPALAAILSEARKFNLFVVLTQQYFGQIEKDLQDSILTNVSNYYVFRISEEDARKLEGNLKISIPGNVLEAAKQKGQKETDLKLKILTELNPRECIFRVESGGQYLPCVKGKTLDVEPPKQSSNAKLKFVDRNVNKLPEKFIYKEDQDQDTPAQINASQPQSSSEDLIKFNHPQKPKLVGSSQVVASESSTITSSHETQKDNDTSTVNQPQPANITTDHNGLMISSSLGRVIIASYRNNSEEVTPLSPGMSLRDALASQSLKNNKGGSKK
jgi:hypothetical protein